MEKVLEKFQRFPHCSRKMDLYSSTNFRINKALSHYFQPYRIGFRRSTGSKTILQETPIQGEGFGRVPTLALLSQKNGFLFVNQFLHFKALNHSFQPQKIRLRLLTGFKTILQETQIQGKSYGRVSKFALLSHKNYFVFVNQFSHFKALSHWFQSYKVRFELLTGFKTILQETQIYGEGLISVSTFAWLSEKNGLVFVNQYLRFKGLSHSFQTYKIRFCLLTVFKTILQETQI